MSEQQSESEKLLSQLKSLVSPELYSQVQTQLGRGSEVADNQNQNQGKPEELARLKPDVLREVTGLVKVAGQEADDNQNQNQGKLEDLLQMKPAVLRQLRANLRPGDEVMDNQNQNQGTVAESVRLVKPPLTESQG